MKKGARIKWNVVIDLILLAIFSISTICLFVSMVTGKVGIVGLTVMFGIAKLADGSLCNVIEE